MNDAEPGSASTLSVNVYSQGCQLAGAAIVLPANLPPAATADLPALGGVRESLLQRANA